ncbi:putative membrane protein [Treponema primitia ZAS-2]|uniref:Putative membrane protein n=2 Tax=Treponema primitia TaxID=88058 RepID=F5YHP1_TREPZ|nr:putative membrane protein [Treponema primitia ZAS-2]
MDKIYKHPVLIVVIIGIITLFFALQLPRAELDNNNSRFVPDTDPAKVTNRLIDDTFGGSSFILIGLERKYGDIFDAGFLSRIRDFNNWVEAITIVGDVNSIVSSKYIAGVGDSIVVEKLVGDDFTGTSAEIAELKRRILSWDMYRHSLVSDDFAATQILVSLDISDDDMSNRDVADEFLKIRDMAQEMFSGMAEVYVTGLPIISETINESMGADLVLMIPLVILVVLLVLFFSFHRLTAVLLPLLTVVIAVIWSVGAMPLFDIKLSIISTVLPVILIAVGSAYGIHVITHYIEDIGSKSLNAEEHRFLVIALMRKIRKPISLAALTTFAGFCSFCFTKVVPIREFGFFSSFGVIVSFAVSMTLIPALLLLRGPRPLRKVEKKEEAGETNRVVTDVFLSIVRKKRTVLIFTSLIVLISVYGVSKVIIDNVFIEYFKSNTDIARSDKFIRDKFGGSKVVNVVFEADNSETLLMPASLSAMDGLNTYLEKRIAETGKTMGFTDLIKRINQVFNADESPGGIRKNYTVGEGQFDSFGFGGETGLGFGEWDDAGFTDPETMDGYGQAPSVKKDYTFEEFFSILDRAVNSGENNSMNASEFMRSIARQINYEGASYYEIPRDPEFYGKTTPEELQRLVSNYLVLLSGSIDSYSDDALEPRAIKTTVQLRTLGMIDTGRVIQEIRRFTDAMAPENIKVIIGGTALVEEALNELVVHSQLISVFISLGIVFLILGFSNHSIIAGVIGIVPLSISILINFAVMGFLGIKLNIGTSMVASVSIGIGIDYTIHYMEAFKREYIQSHGRGDFLQNTFAASGKAILINAISVGAGFAVLYFSHFVILKNLGLLIALTMGTSGLVSLTVLPVLLLTIKPKFIYREV